MNMFAWKHGCLQINRDLITFVPTVDNTVTSLFHRDAKSFPAETQIIFLLDIFSASDIMPSPSCTWTVHRCILWGLPSLRTGCRLNTWETPSWVFILTFCQDNLWTILLSEKQSYRFESLKTVHTLVPIAIEAKEALVTARVKFPFTSSLVITHWEVAYSYTIWLWSYLTTDIIQTRESFVINWSSYPTNINSPSFP